MKLNVPEVNEIKKNWKHLLHTGILASGENWESYLKVYDRHDKQVPVDFYTAWKDPQSSRLAFRIQKAYWAKGRKMRIESGVEEIMSGEYVVVWKAVANSYDKEDFVMVEFSSPEIVSPKQALAWLERKMAELEEKDGLTTEKIIADMKVR